MTKETYRTNGEPCSIGLVTYTATTKPESTVSKRTNERRRKGLKGARTGVTTSGGEKKPNEKDYKLVKQTKEDEKGSRWLKNHNPRIDWGQGKITVVTTSSRVAKQTKEDEKGSKYSNGYKQHPGEKKPKGDYKLV